MNKIIGFMITLVLVVLVVSFFLAQRPNERNYEYAPEMAYSFAYQAQSENPFLPKNQTQQNPPAHSIARNTQPLHFTGENADQELKQAAKLINNPFEKIKNDQSFLQRGQIVYQNFCQVCHGASGKGDGLIVQHGFPAPPSLLTQRVNNFTDGQIFYIITFGYKNMPSYYSQISPEDRWKVTAYVRKLQESQP